MILRVIWHTIGNERILDKRTYILAYSPLCPIYNKITNPSAWIFEDGIFANAFPVKQQRYAPVGSCYISLGDTTDLAKISTDFNKKNLVKPFCNAGIMIDGKYWTYQTEPDYNGEYIYLQDILATGKDREMITEDYYIQNSDLPKWE